MTSIALNRCGFTKCETLVECLTVKPKNRPDPAGARKIAVVVTAVDFDQFSRYIRSLQKVQDRTGTESTWT